MSAPYQYAPPPAMPAQRPAGGGFDLDELLGTRPAPPPPPAPPQQQPAYGGYATAQPAPPPPPPNEDPFGFNTQWQQQQQAPPPPPPQPQPQQQQPLQASYQYGAPAPTPVAYAQPPASPGYTAPPAAQPQPAYAPPPQQQQQQQPGYAPTAAQQPMSRYDPYYAQQQQQQQPQPVQAPQPAPTPYAYGGQPQAAAVNQAPPQTAAPTAYAYPAAAAAQPQPTAAYVYPASPQQQQQQQQQQAPVASPQQQQPQAEWTPQRQGSAQYAAVMQQAQPQPQPQAVPVAYGYPGAVAPTPQPAVTYAAVASGYPVPVAPIQPQQTTYNEDQDRANLERIRRLREQLEREQAAEAAAMAARNGGGGVVASVGTTATTGLAAPSDGWQCRTCTFKNALSATACQMCDEARPGYSKPVPAQQQPLSTAVATGQVIRASATNASSGGDWTCQMCQGRNAPISGICKICNSPRVIESTPVATPSAPANVWACTNCTLHNPNTLMRCQACDYMKPGAPSRNAASVVAPPPTPPPVQSLPSVPANWNCTTCTFENSVEAPACSMCATPRPSHVTDAINARQRAQQQQASANVLPFEASVNGRRLTPEEQERLVRQQAQILEAIQRQQQLGGNTSTNAGRTAPSGARVVAPPQQHDSDDEDPEEPVQWQKDTDAKQCNKCSAAFGVFLRRHHCRSCGFVFCKNCCGNFMTLKTGGKTERVCNDCHKEKTSPAPVVSRPPVAASYPVQQPARDTRPAVQAVPRISCDCVAAAEGFHRPGCHNNPSSLASFL